MKSHVCREFGLVQSTKLMFRKKRIKIVSSFKHNGSRIKRLPDTERCEIDEVLLKWFKQYRSENVPVSSSSHDNVCYPQILISSSRTF
jgi:hypothetical protein